MAKKFFYSYWKFGLKSQKKIFYRKFLCEDGFFLGSVRLAIQKNRQFI